MVQEPVLIEIEKTLEKAIEKTLRKNKRDWPVTSCKSDFKPCISCMSTKVQPVHHFNKDMYNKRYKKTKYAEEIVITETFFSVPSISWGQAEGSLVWRSVGTVTLVQLSAWTLAIWGGSCRPRSLQPEPLTASTSSQHGVTTRPQEAWSI